VSEDVRVPGGADAFAQTAGVRPTPDRARFVAELARLLYGTPERRVDARPGGAEAVMARLRRLPRGPDAETVPIPLSADVWSNAIFHRRVASDDLLTAILSDRSAALLCYGLAAVDDETLQYLASQPALLLNLYERQAPLVAAFGDSLRIRGGAVVPPGGDAGVPLWEAVVGERVTAPARFVPALFERADGRLAYLYDMIGALDAPHAAFALGLWIDAPAPRLVAMQTLVAAWTGWFKEWRVRSQPFARQTYDPAVLLARVAVDQNGRPSAPNSRELWSRAMETTDLPEPGATADLSDSVQPFDAAWLIESGIVGDPRVRGDRLDQLSFAQRVFNGVTAAAAADAYTAVRSFRRYRMLVLALERMGVRDPAVYAAAVRRAAQLGSPDAARAYAATAQFEGALALIVRMHDAGSLAPAQAAALVSSLTAVPLANGQYAGGVLAWLTGALCPAADAPAPRCDEAAIVSALAGRSRGAPPSITWEGHAYRIDPAAAERLRIEQVRMAQRGPSLDSAFEAALLAREVSNAASTVDAPARIKQLIAAVPTSSNRSAEDQGLPPGVQPPPDPAEPLARAEQALARGPAAANRTRAAAALVEAADDLGAETLVSIVYALSLGDPDGPALVAGDISRRHDFGFGSRDVESRLRTPWMTPTQDASNGIAWHVDGSLLGLDVGLATLHLRRLGADRPLDAPTLSSNQRQVFAETVALMSPALVTDASRDAIARAIGDGERRVNDAGGALDVEPILAAVHVDGWRARAIRWTAVHDRARLESMFSLREMAALGGLAATADLDRWGTSAVGSAGCWCTVAPPAALHALATGRPQLGLLAATVSDLELHVARMLAELQVPAAVAPFVLSGVVQDFADSVRPTDGDDWLTLVRTARTFTREQIEDYIAAATADGPLIPDASGGRE